MGHDSRAVAGTTVNTIPQATGGRTPTPPPLRAVAGAREAGRSQPTAAGTTPNGIRAKRSMESTRAQHAASLGASPVPARPADVGAPEPRGTGAARRHRDAADAPELGILPRSRNVLSERRSTPVSAGPSTVHNQHDGRARQPRCQDSCNRAATIQTAGRTAPRFPAPQVPTSPSHNLGKSFRRRRRRGAGTTPFTGCKDSGQQSFAISRRIIRYERGGQILSYDAEAAAR